MYLIVTTYHLITQYLIMNTNATYFDDILGLGQICPWMTLIDANQRTVQSLPHLQVRLHLGPHSVVTSPVC